MGFRLKNQLPPIGLYGKGVVSGTNTAWPAANRAIVLNMLIPRYVAFTRVRFIVGNQSGNMDIGIYDNGFTKLYSTGSFAVPLTTTAPADIALPAMWTLNPGNYYLAMSVDNIVAQFRTYSLAEQVTKYRAIVNAAFPLPASLGTPTFSQTVTLPILYLAEAGY